MCFELKVRWHQMAARKVLPSPRGWPVVGTLGSLLAAGGAQRLHEYVHRRHQQLGPIYREKIGPVEGVFVSSPELMRRVFAAEGRYPAHVIPDSWALFNQTYSQQRGLLFMEGEEWLRYRKLLNPVVLKPDTAMMERALSAAADKLLNQWTDCEVPHTDLQQFYTWSLNSVVAVLLGGECYMRRERELDGLLEELSATVHHVFVESGKLSLMSARLAQLMRLPAWNRFVDAVTSSFATATELIERLLSWSSEEGSERGMLQQLQLAGLSSAHLNRIVIDLILAAGDTTAYTMQWLLYLLGENRELQETVHSARQQQQEHHHHLLKGCMRETLRLYPVAPFITRYLPKSLELHPYMLDKGDLVIMSLYTSGRCEADFPQADAFLPERWLRNRDGYEGVKNPYGSLPFAMGARSCIGRKMAEMQIITTASKIIDKFVIVSGNQKRVEMMLHLIAVPREPLQISLHRRSPVLSVPRTI